MSGRVLLDTLAERGVKVWAEAGRLELDAPHGALDDELLAVLRSRKGDLLDLLANQAGPESAYTGNHVQTMVQVPASAPRPEWSCPNCRFQVWSKCDGQDWYCCNCNAAALWPVEVIRG